MPSLVGVWKLVEARAFDEAGRKVPSPLGPHPMGVAIIDAERIMAMASDGRTELPPETKRAFAAYCGQYTFDGTKLVYPRRRSIKPRHDGGSGSPHPV